MTEIEIITRLEEITDNDEGKTLLQALKEKNILRCGKCENWDQTDNYTPAAGRCKEKKSGGANVITFDYEECQVQTESEAGQRWLK